MVNADVTDNKIVELIGVVKKQQAEVADAEKETKRGWKTNCSLNIVGFSQPLNLTVASLENILKAYGMLLTVTSNVAEAAKIIGVPAPTTYDGYPIDDWADDFKKRVAMIQIKEKKIKLNAVEERLNSIVSPEVRRQMELELIMKELG